MRTVQDYWYYSDGNGKLVTNQIKTINGKKYAFDNYGRMIDGFVVLQMQRAGAGISSRDIVEKLDDKDRYDTEDNYEQICKG